MDNKPQVQTRIVMQITKYDADGQPMEPQAEVRVYHLIWYKPDNPNDYIAACVVRDPYGDSGEAIVAMRMQGFVIVTPEEYARVVLKVDVPLL